ncbi:MAG: acetate--CoA ligase family protein [Thermoplasmata archaeon]|nr:acetate--CoA ligase family protein [Thermoplasmata archaeon]
MRELDEAQSKELLKKYGIPVPEFVVVDNVESIKNIEYPVAVKVCSPHITHKTDVGGVILHIGNEKELNNALNRMKKKFPNERILVEKMEEHGVEMIAGVIKDDFFGHVVMAGMGGIFTEVYEDISFRKIPITREDAEEMIFELKGGKIFEKFRIKLDKEAFIDLLMKISDMALKEKILQMDLNPVFVYENGIKVVDAKVIAE